MHQIARTPLHGARDDVVGTLVRLRDVSLPYTRQQALSQQNAELREAHQQLEAALAEQRRLGSLIRMLSLPIIPVAAQIIVAPLVGDLDASRMASLGQELLAGITQHRARVALVDITGVPIIDTEVAQTLLRVVQAARLLGTVVMLVGIRPEIAQTLVSLGISLDGIEIDATLQRGLARALAQTQGSGYATTVGG
jgi:rsbT co-antagonist protein RsbR